MKLEKVARLLSLVFFFGTIVFFSVMTLIMPREDFSQTENRMLTDKPALTFESYLDESFMKQTEDYLADSFFLRQNFISSKTTFELMLGKVEIGDVIFTDDRMVQVFPSISTKQLSENIEAVNELAELTDTPVFAMIVPTAVGVYREELPRNCQTVDQKALINNIYSRMSSSITTLDAYSALYSARDNYIYYKTDHHWTTLGAFFAYESTAANMGFTPVKLNNYSIEHITDGFYGTLYSKAPTKRYGSDMIDVFHAKNGYNVSEVEAGGEIYDTMYFYDNLDVLNKYAFYLGNATIPKVTISSECPSGKKLLVIKDSYAQCLVPFYTQHYSQIDMVDLRTFATAGICNAVNLDEYDAILIVYNLSGFAEDDNIVKLSF